jgi:hypothetical protein
MQVWEQFLVCGFGAVGNVWYACIHKYADARTCRYVCSTLADLNCKHYPVNSEGLRMLEGERRRRLEIASGVPPLAACGQFVVQLRNAHQSSLMIGARFGSVLGVWGEGQYSAQPPQAD